MIRNDQEADLMKAPVTILKARPSPTPNRDLSAHHHTTLSDEEPYIDPARGASGGYPHLTWCHHV